MARRAAWGLTVIAAVVGVSTSAQAQIDLASECPQHQIRGCDLYASNEGGGDGTALSGPLRVREFLDSGIDMQGEILCLLDGVYRGADSMIDCGNGTVCQGVSGTGLLEISIRTCNDGGVLFDGEGVREPVVLSGNRNWNLEGFDACCSVSDVISIQDVNHPSSASPGTPDDDDGSDHVNIRRVVAWDANPAAPGNNHVISVGWSTEVLLEDVAVFGTGRKGIQIYRSRDVTVRRAWGRWEGNYAPDSPSSQPTTTFSCSYESCGSVCENLIGTWSAEQQGAEELALGPDSIFGIDPQLWVDVLPVSTCEQWNVHMPAYLLYGGSLAYLRDLPSLEPGPTGDPRAPISLVRLRNANDVELRDVVAYVESGAGDDTDPPDPVWFEEPDFGRGFEVRRLTQFSDLPGQILGGVKEWTTPLQLSPDPVTVKSEEFNIFAPTSSDAAVLCDRWQGGVGTGQPLWPWPMNERIRRATSRPEASGSAVVDVMSEVQAIFGPIPAECFNSTCFDFMDNDLDGAIDLADPDCESQQDLSEFPACSDGFDNDGDGKVDFGQDPGCMSRTSDDEAPQCNDGVDNDFDVAIDYPYDPGCGASWHRAEGVACDDDFDNDGDGNVDWDGGSLGAPKDNFCSGPRDSSEVCGLGFELVFAAPLLVALGAARRVARRRIRMP